MHKVNEDTERKFRHIGTRPIRPDGEDKVTGRANFGADYYLPGMLHGAVLRSPYAHAKIKTINLDKANKMPGVFATICGTDFPAIKPGEMHVAEGGVDYSDLADNVMARTKVRYHGHVVAAVAARTANEAMNACAAIAVEYEPLAIVMDLEAAMAEDAVLINEQLYTSGLPEKPEKPSNVAAKTQIGRGDVAQGFAIADVVLEKEYRTATVHQGYIEPHSCTVKVGVDGRTTIWCSTQGPFSVRAGVAKVLGKDIGLIKVVPCEIGGGFGGKTTMYYEPLAVLLASKSGRPVRMTMSREDVFRATGPASAILAKIKIGAQRDGVITAMQVWLGYEAGAYPGSPVMPGVMCATAPYDVANVMIEGFDVLVNKPKVAAYRAPGAPQAMYAVESLLDDMARTLEIDPIELRIINAVEEGSTAIYGPKFKAIGLKACLQAAQKHKAYTSKLAGKNQGRGLAVGFWFNAGMQSSAGVYINEDGSVKVVEGNPDIGGSRASMAILAAEELGVPYATVQVQVVDTDSVGYTDVTGGSRVTFATGMAVVQAASKVCQDLCERAASIWNIDVDQVKWENGCAVVVNSKKDTAELPEPMSIKELAKKAASTGGPIGEQVSLNARGAGPSFSVNIVDLEVDSETGRVEVLAFTAIQDAGRAIHPAYVEGQMQGGAAQGLGWALNEEYVWDENGVMSNAGFLDYRIPVASDLPMIDTLIIEVPNPGHPYGVRGVGETPIVGPLAAVANAVRDATGVRIANLPLSPVRILSSLDKAI